VMPRNWLLTCGVVFFAAFIVAAGGAAPRYNRIVFGALPLVLALVCFGTLAYLRGRNQRAGAWRSLGVCCWLLACTTLVMWNRPSLIGAAPPEPRIERAHALLTLARDRARLALFAELQPVELANCQLQRFGEQHDGGYLMCANLLGSIKAAYSYGISGYDGWGCDVARMFNVPVHQYDCFDLRQPVCQGGVTVFHAECIGPAPRRDEGGRHFDTLQSQFASSAGPNRVVLKMDVEGAEWETLLQTPPATLERIDQFAVELHGVGEGHQLATVRRLKQFFHVANIHYNNHTCAERLDPFPAPVYEVLFVNKRLTTAGQRRRSGPHALDAPNSPQRPDCQIPTTRWTHALPGALRFWR
jgi:hypothetical protein